MKKIENILVYYENYNTWSRIDEYSISRVYVTSQIVKGWDISKIEKIEDEKGERNKFIKIYMTLYINEDKEGEVKLKVEDYDDELRDPYRSYEEVIYKKGEKKANLMIFDGKSFERQYRGISY